MRLIAVAALTTVVTAATFASADDRPLIGSSFRSFTFTGNAQLFDIDPQTGAATNPRATGVDAINGLAWGPDNLLYATTDLLGVVNGDAAPSRLLTIDPADGRTTIVGNTGLDLAEGDLAFQPQTGVLFGVQQIQGNGTLFTIDTATGVADVVGTIASGVNLSGMGFTPAGDLWVVDHGLQVTPPPGVMHRVDPATGDILQTLPLDTPLGNTGALEWDPSRGTFLLADGDNSARNALFSVNLTTGQLTRIGTTIEGPDLGGGFRLGGLGGLTFIPEPSTAVGLIAAGGFLLRRRNPR